MVERIANRVVGGYKRKKLSLNATSSMDDSLQQVESHDMEYEETPGVYPLFIYSAYDFKIFLI